MHPFQFNSVAKPCPNLFDFMDCSTSGPPVHHQLLEFTQIHVHQVSDAIQPSYPLSSLLFSPSILPSIRVFSNESVHASGGQSIGVSASASVLPMNIQDWFHLGWNGWIFLQSQGLSRVSSNTTLQKHQFFGAQLSLQSNSHIHIANGKTIALARQTFVGKVMSMLFNMLSKLVLTFLPRSKPLLISWLQSLSVVILEPPRIKSVIVSTVSPSICHEVMGLDAMILVFWMLSFKPTFSLSLSFSSRGSLVFLCFLS